MKILVIYIGSFEESIDIYGYNIMKDREEFELRFDDYKYQAKGIETKGKTEKLRKEDFIWRGDGGIEIEGLEHLEELEINRGVIELKDKIDELTRRRVYIRDFKEGEVRRFKIDNNWYKVRNSKLVALEDYIKMTEKVMENIKVIVGDSLEIEYSSFKELRNDFEIDDITEEEAKVLQKRLGKRFSIFPF